MLQQFHVGLVVQLVIRYVYVSSQPHLSCTFAEENYHVVGLRNEDSWFLYFNLLLQCFVASVLIPFSLKC